MESRADLQFLGCHYYPFDTVVPVTGEAHAHAFNELLLVTTGVYRAQIGRRTLTVAPGHFVVYPAGFVRRPLRSTGTPICFYILKWLGRCPFPAGEARRDVQARLQLVLDMISQGVYAGRETFLRNLFYAALNEVTYQSERYQATRTIDSLAARARLFIEEVSETDISIPAICQFLGVSPASLHRAFRKEMGTSPVVYLQRVRAAHALRLITTTTIALDRIAELVGVKNARSLRRLFDKIYGRSPGSFRRDRSGS